MNLEELQKAQNLVTKLESGLDKQYEVMMSVRKSLMEYQDFLQQQIIEAREERGEK